MSKMRNALHLTFWTFLFPHNDPLPNDLGPYCFSNFKFAVLNFGWVKLYICIIIYFWNQKCDLAVIMTLKIMGLKSELVLNAPLFSGILKGNK